MAVKQPEQLKEKFLPGAIPTDQDFSDMIDSFRHKAQKIPGEDINGWEYLSAGDFPVLKTTDPAEFTAAVNTVLPSEGPGEYPHFLDSSDTPLNPTTEQFSDGRVEFRKLPDGSWEIEVVPLSIAKATQLNEADEVEVLTGKPTSDYIKDKINPPSYAFERVPELCDGADVAAVRTIVLNQVFTQDIPQVLIYCVSPGQITLGSFVIEGSNIYRASGLSVTLAAGLNLIDFVVPAGQRLGYFKQIAGGGVGRMIGDTSANYGFYSFSVGVSSTPVALPAQAHQIRFGIKAIFKKPFVSLTDSIQKSLPEIPAAEIFGKNIVSFSDSIGSHDGHPHNYADRIARISKATSYYNLGIGGATFAWNPDTVEDPNPVGGPGSVTNVISNQVLKYISMAVPEYPELALFSAGINDTVADKPIGDIPSIFAAELAALDKKQFAAAIRYAVETFRVQYPKCFVALITPLHSIVEGRKYDDALPYVAAIKECAARLNIPVIDCFSSVQIPEFRAEALLTDGLHPNGLGQELHFKFIWSWLKSNYYKLDYSV